MFHMLSAAHVSCFTCCVTLPSRCRPFAAHVSCFTYVEIVSRLSSVIHNILLFSVQWLNVYTIMYVGGVGVIKVYTTSCLYIFSLVLSICLVSFMGPNIYIIYCMRAYIVDDIISHVPSHDCLSSTPLIFRSICWILHS